MINKILEPEERVYIKNYSQAEFFFEFYKNECGAQHPSVSEKKLDGLSLFSIG